MDITDIEDMLPIECVKEIATMGSNDEACEWWASVLDIPCSRDELLEIIDSYGAGDEDDCNRDIDKLWACVLWIAAHNVKDYRAIED